MTIDERRLTNARKPGFGLGLLKGMAVTFKHLFKHNTVIQYPDTKRDLPSRSRGVIALKEENCTVCMLCARECPDWCIYIDSHKEQLAPKRQGGRPRKRNVLDRFAIDYALCMYCGICVEVCPYDALFWSREFEYSEYDIREMTHEKERLSDWMATVLPPPELEDGAELPGHPASPATTAAPSRPATPTTKPTQTASAAEARPDQEADAPKAPTAAPTASKQETDEERSPAATSETQVEEGHAPDRAETAAPAEPAPAEAEPSGATSETQAATSQPAQNQAEPTATQAEPAATQAGPAPAQAEPSGATSEPAPAQAEPASARAQSAPAQTPAPAPAPSPEELEAVYSQTLEEQLAKGSSPQVAEARAKVARVKAERGVLRPPTPVATDHRVPSAPTKGEAPEPTPSGAPRAEEPEPEQGPVAAVAEERDEEAAPAAEASAPAPAPDSGPEETPRSDAAEDPEAAYERVLAEERAKGSSDAVATGRAKAARVRAAKGTKGPSS